MAQLPCAAEVGGDLHEFRLVASKVLRESIDASGWAAAVADEDPREARARLRAFDRELHRRGWSGIPIAAEAGGQGLTLLHQIVFLDEANALGVPTPYNRVALGIVTPALTHFGTDEQKRRYLPPLIACDEVWCQGFSEPGAGSDLASLRTRARRGEDGAWHLDGQKVWTTLGCEADLCFVLARTGTQAERHKGITAFVTPMSAPGVTVRPIAQINGEADFAEVFFTDVIIGPDAVLGDVGHGWEVAMTALGHERSVHLLQRQSRLEEMVRALVESDVDTTAVAGELLELRIDAIAMHYAVEREVAALTAGEPSGVTGNATKVLWSETYQRLARLRLSLAAAAGESAGLAGWAGEYYTSLATSIYAGTNEVQRSIIGERGLGLPR